MPVDVASYLLGALSTLAVLGAFLAARRARQRLRARTRERQRRRAAAERRARHDAQKARVRFVPTEKLEDGS
ncbi:MAG: hypothetical protein ACTH32_13840 [Microbacterium gubbeenense]|uniref:hypothetical protein n=1 Tax=Microbacterium TaxID=33882 RepID=UPI0012F9749B|nr:hypothetical protein [Microbacterium gubbeenense]